MLPVLLAVLVFLASGPGVLGEDDCESPQASGDPGVIKQLRVEINTLNLMNGLHLSVEQVEALLAGARENRELRTALLGEGGGKTPPAVSSKERYEALLELKGKLERGEDTDGAYLRELKKRLETGKAAKPFRPDRARYHRELRALERGIEKILLESQKDVISTYKPCLIPPKNLKDPVRVGQAANRTAAGKMLERMRKLSQSRWDKMGRAILERALGHWEERKGKFSEEERSRELEKALAVVNEARALSEIEFQMKKDDLAKRVTFTDRKDDLKKELKGLLKERHDPPGTIAMTLLDPRIIPVLERRLKQMQGFEPDKPMDLAGIKGADAKKGKCGKKYKDCPGASAPGETRKEGAAEGRPSFFSVRVVAFRHAQRNATTRTKKTGNETLKEVRLYGGGRSKTPRVTTE
jgi:hypothetical protein